MIAKEYLAAIVSNVRSANAKEKIAAERHFSLARSKADALAVILRDEYGASSVWLVGSAAHGRHFRSTSDIDLAVEGLSARLTIPAGLRLEKEVYPEFPHVDLIRMEECDDGLREMFLQEAIKLV